MAARVFVLVFLCIVGQQGTDACWNGWVQYQDTCYLIKDMQEKWPDASSYCRALGARLAIVDSAEEDTFLRNQLMKRNASEGYWLDGEDIDSENNWFWASIHTNIAEYKGWYPGQPDDQGGQDCLVMFRHYAYQWDDNDCDSVKFGYICEVR